MALNSLDLKSTLFLISLCIIIHQSICKKPKDLQITTEVNFTNMLCLFNS